MQPQPNSGSLKTGVLQEKTALEVCASRICLSLSLSLWCSRVLSFFRQGWGLGIALFLCLSLLLAAYIFFYTHIHTYIYMYVYLCISLSLSSSPSSVAGPIISKLPRWRLCNQTFPDSAHRDTTSNPYAVSALTLGQSRRGRWFEV